MSINLTILKTMLLTIVLFVGVGVSADWTPTAQGIEIDVPQNVDVYLYFASPNLNAPNFAGQMLYPYDNLPYGQNNNGTTVIYGSTFINSPVVLVFVTAGSGFPDGTTYISAINDPDTVLYAYSDQNATCAGIGSVSQCLANIINDTWGNNGFWGASFTTNDVSETLEASVQATGAELWPLLVFVGIAIAFIVFLQLVFLVNHSVKPKKVVKKKSDSYGPENSNHRDYRAYKRGREIIEKEHPDFYKN